MIEYRLEGRVARIILDRPEKRNALNPALADAIEQALGRAAQDPAASVVLLSANGPDFCAGMDLAALLQTSDPGVMDHLADAQRIANLYLAIRRSPRPVIAAVHGRAVGGGCGLVTAADLAIAAQSATFRYSEINLGFVPAIVASLLRRSLGEKQAFEVLTFGEAFSAAEALRLGMINRIVDAPALEREALDFAATLAAKSASALSLTKRLLNHMDGMSLEAAMEAGIQTNALARSTPDAQRGIEGFVRQRLVREQG